MGPSIQIQDGGSCVNSIKELGFFTDLNTIYSLRSRRFQKSTPTGMKLQASVKNKEQGEG